MTETTPMNSLLKQLRKGFRAATGDLRAAGDRAGALGYVRLAAPAFLTHHGCPNTAAHSAAVAREAARIAGLFGLDRQQAEMAGWLHDISGVILGGERLAAAQQLGLAVLPEEEQYPPILHQKLSAVLARELFGVTDPAVLSAIGCHTTLKRDAAPLDKLLFVADKIAWDQADAAPYLTAITAALAESLDRAALVYLTWMWEQRTTLAVVHPWLREAYQGLAGREW